MLAGRVIHATTYWTETNIANGLNALAICIEVRFPLLLPMNRSKTDEDPGQMVFFALLMWWAYSPSEYKTPGAKKGSAWRALWDSVNFCKHHSSLTLPSSLILTCIHSGLCYGDLPLPSVLRYLWPAQPPSPTRHRKRREA